MTIVLPSVSALILLITVWVVLHVDQVSKIVGYLASGLAVVWRTADRTAVKYRVEGDVNSSVKALLERAPADVFEGKLQIKWVSGSQAQALIKEGKVLVCMRRSAHHEENIANALVAYLPKAVVPRARRYASRRTMRAVDLVLAKSLLVRSGLGAGYLQVFYDQHLEPALDADEVLKKKVERTDAIEISGWLTRIYLVELRAYGDRLYPSESHARYALETERFHSWLYTLASRPSGALRPLAFDGELLRIGMIMVAKRPKLEREGLRPYLRWFDIYMNEMKVDSIYVVGSDETIDAVKAVASSLKDDPRVESLTEYEYSHGRQFRARVAPRQRAICLVVRRLAGAPHYIAAGASAVEEVEEIAVLRAGSKSPRMRDLEAVPFDAAGLDELIEGAVAEELAEGAPQTAHADLPEDDMLATEEEPDESMPSLLEVKAYVQAWVSERESRGRPAYVAVLGNQLRDRFPGSEPVHERLGYERFTNLLDIVEGITVSGPGWQATASLTDATGVLDELPLHDDILRFIKAWVDRQARLHRHPFLSSLGFALRTRFRTERPVHEELDYPSLRDLVESYEGLTVEGQHPQLLVRVLRQVD